MCTPPRRLSERIEREIPSLSIRQKSWTADGKSGTSSPLNGLVRIVEICHDGDDSTSYILTETSTTIGRDESSAVRIDVQTVSRNHSKLQYDENGKVWLRQISDSKSTFLNGERVDEARQLEHGDIIEIGGRFFRFDSGKSPKGIAARTFSPRLKRKESTPLSRTCSVDDKPSGPSTPQPKAVTASKTLSTDEIRQMCHRRGHSLPAIPPQWQELDSLPKKNSINDADKEAVVLGPAAPQSEQTAATAEEGRFEVVASASSPIGSDLLAKKYQRTLRKTALAAQHVAASALAQQPPAAPTASPADPTMVSRARRVLRPPPTASELQAEAAEARPRQALVRTWEVAEGEGTGLEGAGEALRRRLVYNRTVHSPSMGLSAEELARLHALHAVAAGAASSLVLAAQELFDGAAAAPQTFRRRRLPESSIPPPSPITRAAPAEAGEEWGCEALRAARRDVRRLYNQSVYSPSMGASEHEMQRARELLMDASSEAEEAEVEAAAGGEAREAHNQGVHSPSMSLTEDQLMLERALHRERLALGEAEAADQAAAPPQPASIEGEEEVGGPSSSASAAEGRKAGERQSCARTAGWWVCSVEGPQRCEEQEPSLDAASDSEYATIASATATPPAEELKLAADDVLDAFRLEESSPQQPQSAEACGSEEGGAQSWSLRAALQSLWEAGAWKQLGLRS